MLVHALFNFNSVAQLGRVN